MMATYTLSIPWTSIDWEALHAHTSGNRKWAKIRATKALREWAQLQMRAAYGTLAPLERARLDVRVWFPDRRVRDLLNVAQTLKPAIDGMVKAGAVVDDRWEILRPAVVTPMGVDPDRPRVEVTIGPATGEEAANG